MTFRRDARLLALLACLALAACQSQPQAPEITQCDMAQFQAGTLEKGMRGLTALRADDPNGAAIYFESLVYNAAADILECSEYRNDSNLRVWLNELAEYRRLHPRPANARSLIDDRLDKLFADYLAKTPVPYRSDQQ